MQTRWERNLPGLCMDRAPGFSSGPGEDIYGVRFIHHASHLVGDEYLSTE